MCLFSLVNVMLDRCSLFIFVAVQCSAAWTRGSFSILLLIDISTAYRVWGFAGEAGISEITLLWTFFCLLAPWYFPIGWIGGVKLLHYRMRLVQPQKRGVDSQTACVSARIAPVFVLLGLLVYAFLRRASAASQFASSWLLIKLSTSSELILQTVSLLSTCLLECFFFLTDLQEFFFLLHILISGPSLVKYSANIVAYSLVYIFILLINFWWLVVISWMSQFLKSSFLYDCSLWPR